jgi:hypothetical protein
VSSGEETVPVDVSWEVVSASNPDGPPLVTGAADDVPANQVPPIGPNDVLDHGTRYIYRGTFETEVPPNGPVVSKASTRFTWDDAVAATGIRFDVRDTARDETIRDVRVFYPERDVYYRQWRDEVDIVVLRDPVAETVRIDELTIKNTAGNVVRRVTDPRRARYWNGRMTDGELAPAGRYAVEATVSDAAGNTAVLARSVLVSHERVQQVTWERTVAPRRSLIDKFVGRCASLKMPARASWRGSIGLRSKASGPRCRDLRAQTVSTIHRLRLPRTQLGRAELYERVQVSAFGGGTPGTGPSYLVQVYWNGDDWVARTQFDKRLGWHLGRPVGPNVVLGDPAKERPVMFWSVGLAEGASYDLKSFKVSVRFWDVR